MAGYLVLFVANISTIEKFQRYVVILVQPLHYKRLKPPEKEGELDQFVVLGEHICQDYFGDYSKGYFELCFTVGDYFEDYLFRKWLPN